MRLTKQTSHAIRILIDCARDPGRSIKVAEIAERLEITPQNVFKIVHILSRAGLIRATRGRNGGVRLAMEACDIRVGDVVRATEVTHIEVENDPPLGVRSKPRVQPINSLFDSALGAFISVLDQHTLADMARSATATAAVVTQPRTIKRPMAGTGSRRLIPAATKTPVR